MRNIKHRWEKGKDRGLHCYRVWRVIIYTSGSLNPACERAAMEAGRWSKVFGNGLDMKDKTHPCPHQLLGGKVNPGLKEWKQRHLEKMWIAWIPHCQSLRATVAPLGVSLHIPFYHSWLFPLPQGAKRIKMSSFWRGDGQRSITNLYRGNVAFR